MSARLNSLAFVTAAWVVAFGLLSAVGRAHAQSVEPFSRLDVSMTVARVSSHGPLGDYYAIGPAPSVRVATPFHYGTVALSAQHLPLNAHDPGRTDIRARAYIGQWNAGRPISSRMEGSAGLRAGLITFKWHEPGVHTGRRIGGGGESEFLIGAQGAVSARIVNGLAVVATAQHDHIFTSTRIRLTSLGAGLQYSVTTPRWFRDALR